MLVSPSIEYQKVQCIYIGYSSFFSFLLTIALNQDRGGGGQWGTGLILGGLQEVAGMHPN
jgi:hypothetical protein